MNELAYEELVLSIDDNESAGKVAFKIVKKSKTAENADGDAHLAWTGLKRKYAPTTAPTLANLHKQFYKAKLKKKTDPDTFMTYLEDIRGRMEEMKSFMSDDQFLLHVLNNVSKEYETQVNNVEKRVGHATNPLDIEELRSDLCLRFERMNADDESDESEDEKALFGAQFKGRCNKCGKWGHKGADCRSKDGDKQGSKDKPNGYGNKKKFDGECHFCHKKGHMKRDCFKWKKEQGEQANQAGDSKKKKKKEKDEDSEIILVAFDSHYDQCEESDYEMA